MKKLLASYKFQAGFTLIELLIVIVIIVIVIGVGAASYTTVARNARNSDRATDLQKIAEALEVYYADYGTYPVTSPGPSPQVQAAGYDCANDVICCLYGGTLAQAVRLGHPDPNIWKCDTPANFDSNREYIKPLAIQGSYGSGIPTDPNYTANVVGLFSEGYYVYVSGGQKYALITKEYEGSAPEKHRFNSSHDYYDEAVSWGGGSLYSFDPLLWTDQYVLDSPTN